MPIYLKYEGIEGAVTAEGHKKWIELDSCQLGVHRSVTNATGRGANREASTPAVSEIVCTKQRDCSSTGLFKASLWGEGKKCTIDFCKTDQNKFEVYMQLELENTLISSYNVSGHGGDNHSNPMESLSLNFTKITFVTTHQDDKNKTGKPDRGSWDLAAGEGA